MVERVGATAGTAWADSSHRARLIRLADWLAVALAASLPWSTSAVSLFAALWLLAVLPTLTLPDLRRVLATPAGALPVLLWLLAAVGMLWAAVPWSDRIAGFEPYHKLLLLPLLMLHVQRTPIGRAMLIAFVASSLTLLAASYAHFLIPSLLPNRFPRGIPVNNHLDIGAMFLATLMILLWVGLEWWRAGRRILALAASVAGVLLLLNIALVLNSRTTLVVLPGLILVFLVVRGGWRTAAIGTVALGLLASALWGSGIYRHERIATLAAEIGQYSPDGIQTSAGERLEFWRKSVLFIAEAPILGHGTGSIPALFRAAAEGHTGVGSVATTNPHQQTFAVAIPLGAVGGLLLWAMWGGHLLHFRRGGSLAAWVGIALVLQNAGGSLFNSHLFDFTHGWLYVVGIGAAAGTVLRERWTAPAAPR